jgi:membrane protein YdbS with pleckstrin-like domain
MIVNAGIVIYEVERDNYWWAVINGIIVLLLGSWLLWVYLNRKRENV